jgi:hypothetical protein
MGWLLSLVPLAAAAVVYRPLVSGYFVSDDFLNLFGIVNADRLEYLLRPHGSHLLVTRNALFVLFHSMFGARADLYFTAVLATHLFNVFLLYRVVLRWTRSTALAVFGGLLWGTCPVQAGALEWYSVYGQVVVATVLLVVLDQVSRLARPGDVPSGLALVLWPMLFAAGAALFGTGIALAIVAPVVIFLLLPPSRRRLGVCAVLLVLALGLRPAYRGLIAWHDQLTGSGSGIFVLYTTLGGLNYRGPILVMFGHLMSYGITSLVLGFAKVTSFPGAISIAVTTAYAVATVVAFTLAPPRMRRVILALLILSAACYGVIAAGRAMYTRAPNLAYAASLARYHYVGTVPLALLLCVIMSQLTEGFRHRGTLFATVILVWLSAATVLYARTPPFIDLHPAARTETMHTLARIRGAIASVPPGSEVRIPNQGFRSIGPLLFHSRSEFPGWAAIYAIFFPTNVADGRRVYFTDGDDAVLRAARHGRRTADLIVSPAVESGP